MDDDAQIAVLVTFLFGGLVWLVALVNAPFLTIFLTFLAIVLGGIFQTSGHGDGREGP